MKFKNNLLFWLTTFFLTGLTPRKIRKLFFILTSEIDLEEPTLMNNLGESFYLKATGSHVMIDTPDMRFAMNHSSRGLAIQVIDSEDSMQRWEEVYRDTPGYYRIENDLWLEILKSLPSILKIARQYRVAFPKTARIIQLRDK